MNTAFSKLVFQLMRPCKTEIIVAESDYFDRNVLGRIGWLDRVKLGLIEQEGTLFLGEYKK